MRKTIRGICPCVSAGPVSATLAIFLHSDAYDRLHQGLSIAAAGAALGRPVEVYFFWWALERLLTDRLDEPDFPEREDVTNRFEARGLPTLRSLLQHLRNSPQVSLVACTGSMAALGLTPAQAEGRVDTLLGWSSILARTAGVTDRFYL
jgi:peroxiredoxin family protein